MIIFTGTEAHFSAGMDLKDPVFETFESASLTERRRLQQAEPVRLRIGLVEDTPDAVDRALLHQVGVRMLGLLAQRLEQRAEPLQQVARLGVATASLRLECAAVLRDARSRARRAAPWRRPRC